MSNADKLQIFPFIKFIYGQHRHIAFVAIVHLIHYCLLYTAELLSVYDVTHFRKKEGLEFFIFTSYNRFLFKILVSCTGFISTFYITMTVWTTTITPTAARICMSMLYSKCS